MFVSASCRTRLSFDIPAYKYRYPIRFPHYRRQTFLPTSLSVTTTKSNSSSRPGLSCTTRLPTMRKILYDATKNHGKENMSSYDAVFMSPENETPMKTEDAIESATGMQMPELPLFYLSTFIGVGSMSGWSDD